MPAELGKFAGDELQNMGTCILSAISLAALGLVIVQTASGLTGRGAVVAGHLIALMIWMSSVSIVGLELWRHLRMKRDQRATGSDVAVYAIVALVMVCLALALGWLAAVTLTFKPRPSGADRGDRLASCSDMVASLNVKSLAASDSPDSPTAASTSSDLATLK